VVLKIGSFDSLSKTAYMELFSRVLVDFKHSGLLLAPEAVKGVRVGILPKLAMSLTLCTYETYWPSYIPFERRGAVCASKQALKECDYLFLSRRRVTKGGFVMPKLFFWSDFFTFVECL